MILIRSLLLAFFLSAGFSLQAQLQKQFEWGRLPEVPSGGGALLGYSDGVLLCIGGRDSGGKASAAIYALGEGASSWRLAGHLPDAVENGVAFSAGNRVIIAGGSNGSAYSNKVYALSYASSGLRIDSLASLPFPLANMTGAVIGENLLIAGGSPQPGAPPGKYFLTLHPGGHHRGWTRLPAWPGPGRTGAVAAAMQGDFYLFGGITGNRQGDDPLIAGEAPRAKDAYRFIPTYQGNRITGGRWTRLSDAPVAPAPGPGPAPTMGLDHILLPGKASGASPGGNAHLWAYHTGTGSWIDFGALPGAAGEGGNEGYGALTTASTGQKWVILHDPEPGQQSPAPRTLSKKMQFGWINWLTLLVYLGLMIWIGFIYDKKEEQTAANFFTAGGRIPWWAAGLSIYGTQLSAITFMAIPAIVFATDWSLAIGSVLILATVPIVSRYYIPFFRKLSITSAYEYLEHRFSRNVRLLGSLSFILFQMGRMGIVLYLPAVAIASVTGSDIYLLIAIMGIICVIYTVMGGIEAVVWTDSAQVVVLLGGAVTCLFVAIANIEGGMAHVVSRGLEEGKFALFHLGWTPDRPVLWVCIVGFFFLNIIPYTSDQTVVQRYLTVKDEKRATRSLWTNALITLPGTVVFFGLGTVLYVFYKENPGIIASEKIDEILPYFVVRQLPAGVAGLVIAGIFAASQSTLSSSMNSIAASYTSDIFHRFNPRSTERESLSVARWVTIAAGVFGTGSAMLIAFLDVQFIFDLFQEVLGILGGSLAGVFILGIFTKRANTRGVVAGLIIGALAVWLVKGNTNISVYLYGAISVLTCVVSGYLISLLTPSRYSG